MSGEMISVSTGDGQFDAYLARSTSGKGPGVIVIQEWWGLVDHIKNVADRFAEAGLTALVPDLYGGKTTTDPDEAATLLQALNITDTEQILRKAVLVLLTNSAVEGERAGVVGYCMGGQLALLAACNNPAIGAAVDYYGIHPNVQLALRDLSCPVLGFFAEHDKSASPEAVRALDQELSVFGKDHLFTTYPGAHHAFFNDDRPEVYNSEAAHDSWEKMLAFFWETIGGRPKATQAMDC